MDRRLAVGVVVHPSVGERFLPHTHVPALPVFSSPVVGEVDGLGLLVVAVVELHVAEQLVVVVVVEVADLFLGVEPQLFREAVEL